MDDDDITQIEDLETFDFSEETPTDPFVCTECGGELVLVREDWRPPETAEEAWSGWHAACVVVGKLKPSWRFCCRTGGCWVDGQRRDFERRRRAALDPWPGDRRRLAPLKASAPG